MDATASKPIASERFVNALLIGILAFMLSALGLGFRHGPEVSVVWPAASIIIGFLLRVPRLARWEAFIASGLGFCLADYIIRNEHDHVLVSSIANLAFVITGWYLLAGVKPIDRRLGRPQSIAVIHFVSVVAALSSVASALLLEQALGSDISVNLVLRWAIVSYSNAALVLPVLLTAPSWHRIKQLPAWRRERSKPLELLTPVALVVLLAFGIYTYAPTAVTFAMPALIFAALRNGVFKTASLGLLTLGVVLGAVVLNLGDFEVNRDLETNELIVAMQLSLALTVMGPIAVASSTAIRDQELHVALRQAAVDGLTGAYARRAFFEQAEALLEIARVSNRPITVAMVDLDNFKIINDLYGHRVGDVVIQDVARSMQKHMRDTDLLGRLGGDEFAIVRAGVNCDFIWHIADGMRAHVADLDTLTKETYLPVHSGLESVQTDVAKISISVGVVCQDKVTRSFSSLLELADRALYEAKEQKNMVVVHQVK